MIRPFSRSLSCQKDIFTSLCPLQKLSKCKRCWFFFFFFVHKTFQHPQQNNNDHVLLRYFSKMTMPHCPWLAWLSQFLLRALFSFHIWKWWRGKPLWEGLLANHENWIRKLKISFHFLFPLDFPAKFHVISEHKSYEKSELWNEKELFFFLNTYVTVGWLSVYRKFGRQFRVLSLVIFIFPHFFCTFLSDVTKRRIFFFLMCGQNVK